MGWESSDVVRFDLDWPDWPLLQDQLRTAKLKRAYNSFIIDPRGLQCETNLQDIVSCLSGGYRFASVLRCVGLVMVDFLFYEYTSCLESLHCTIHQMIL